MSICRPANPPWLPSPTSRPGHGQALHRTPGPWSALRAWLPFRIEALNPAGLGQIERKLSGGATSISPWSIRRAPQWTPETPHPVCPVQDSSIGTDTRDGRAVGGPPATWRPGVLAQRQAASEDLAQ